MAAARERKRLLEANNPEKWKQKFEQKNTHDISQLSAEQLSELAKRWIAEAATTNPELEARRLELEAKLKAIEGTVEVVESKSDEEKKD